MKGMVKNRRLARAISECGFGMLRSLVESKAAQYEGRDARIINRWEPTSQVCSECGYRWGKLDLSVRSIQCLNCGTKHDRDANAARNIEQSGVEQSQDSNWAVNGHKTRVSGTPIALPSRERRDCPA